jgi:hypothetical protein
MPLEPSAETPDRLTVRRGPIETRFQGIVVGLSPKSLHILPPRLDVGQGHFKVTARGVAPDLNAFLFGRLHPSRGIAIELAVDRRRMIRAPDHPPGLRVKKALECDVHLPKGSPQVNEGVA